MHAVTGTRTHRDGLCPGFLWRCFASQLSQAQHAVQGVRGWEERCPLCCAAQYRIPPVLHRVFSAARQLPRNLAPTVAQFTLKSQNGLILLLCPPTCVTIMAPHEAAALRCGHCWRAGVPPHLSSRRDPGGSSTAPGTVCPTALLTARGVSMSDTAPYAQRGRDAHAWKRLRNPVPVLHSASLHDLPQDRILLLAPRATNVPTLCTASAGGG